jgi:hypothetical protein
MLLFRPKDLTAAPFRSASTAEVVGDGDHVAAEGLAVRAEQASR